jgi:hypothetical protein
MDGVGVRGNYRKYAEYLDGEKTAAIVRVVIVIMTPYRNNNKYWCINRYPRACPWYSALFRQSTFESKVHIKQSTFK